MQAFIGWLISTLLLRFIGGSGNSTSESEMQPSKYTQSNINQIGATIPVVLGRVMIKNPLISYYGDFDAIPYTEEYGTWSELDWDSMILMLIIGIVATLATPNMVITPTGGGTEVTQGTKNALMMTNLANLLMWLLSSLFLNHLGRVTIQKGFKYYLGWQNILCWTGEDIGVKKVWMNVYDTEVEDSTMNGVWQPDNGTLPATEVYRDSVTYNISKNTYVYDCDLKDVYEIEKISFWYGGNTSYIPSIDYEISDDQATYTAIGNETTTGAGYYTIDHAVPSGTKGRYLRITMNCTNIAPGSPLLDVKDIAVTGKPLDLVAYRKDNPTGVVAHIDDDQMFGGWDEGGGFIGDVNLYFGGYQQQKDPWMIKEMTNSASVQPQLQGLTPLYPMFFTCVIDDKDNNCGAYIGKQATIPEMWFEVVNYPHYLGDTQHQKIRQKYVAKLAKLWKPVDEFMKTMKPQVQAFMQPYMDAIINAYNSFASNTSNDDTTQMKQALEDAKTNFPQTDRDQYELVQADVYKLVEHGVWTLGKLEKDLNPAEAIYEMLTNKLWGCQYNLERIDIESLVDLGITCEEEQLGISMLMNQTQQMREYLSKIMTHINGVFFDNPCTGQLVFRLMRNDFEVDQIKHFNVSNCVSCEFSRLDWSEAASAVSVKFTDATDKYNTSEMMVYDLANRKITGTDTQKQVDGQYFTTAVAARWMAQAQLLSAGYPLSMVQIECNRYGFDSMIGDPILVSWQPYGISKQVFRIVDIDYATLTSGKISISAIEDVFSFDKTDYEYSDTPIWDEPEKRPYDIARYMFMEMPYELTFSLDTFVRAWAAQPSNYTQYWNVWRYAGGNYIKSAKSSKWSMCARFVYGLDEAYDFDTVGFEISHVGVNSDQDLDNKIIAINNDPSKYNHNSNLNTLIVNNEIMSYDTIKKLPNGNYFVQGVVRGIFDTVPKSHTAESIIYFIDYSMNVTGTSPIGNGRVEQQGLTKDEQLEIRTETQNEEQPFNVNEIEHLMTTRRSEQPSIMGNLKFGADKGTETQYYYNIPAYQQMSYDVLFTFLGRNKFNSYGIIQQTDDTTPINVATTTQNVLHIECHGEEFEYKWDAWDANNSKNITTMTLKWVDFCRDLGNKVADSNTVVMTIQTYDTNKQLYSYDKYKKTVQYVVPRLVGIVTNPNDVQALADSFVQPSLNSIILPETPVSPQLTLTFEDCPLIFVGNTPAPSGVTPAYGQDGLPYELTTEAYRIDGYDSNGKAIVHKITIEEEFIFRTNYTVHDGNFADYFRRRSGQYVGYTPYEP